MGQVQCPEVKKTHCPWRREGERDYSAEDRKIGKGEEVGKGGHTNAQRVQTFKETCAQGPQHLSTKGWTVAEEMVKCYVLRNKALEKWKHSNARDHLPRSLSGLIPVISEFINFESPQAIHDIQSIYGLSS